MENKKQQKKIDETKSWFFEIKIDKLLVRLAKGKKREDPNKYSQK